MGRLETIRQDLDTDPLGRGYSGMDDAAAAVDINTVHRSAEAPPPTQRVMFVAAEPRIGVVPKEDRTIRVPKE